MMFFLSIVSNKAQTLGIRNGQYCDGIDIRVGARFSFGYSRDIHNASSQITVK
jgi:hypothetical protein